MTDDTITEYFKTCLQRVKKGFVKGLAPEVNSVLAEFELIIAQIRGEVEAIAVAENAEHAEGAENTVTATVIEPEVANNKSKKGTKKAPAGRKKLSKSNKQKKRNSWSGDEDSGDDAVSEPEEEDDYEEPENDGTAKVDGGKQHSKSASAARKPLKDVANKIRGRA